MGFFIAKVLDRGVIEFIGPYGISKSLINTSFNISKLDTGVVTTYSLYITLGLLSLLFIVFYPMLTPVYFSFTDLDSSETSLSDGNNLNIFSEIRLFIIYIAALVLVLSSSAPFSPTER
jgi:NADH-ubiquinone oxidoreductase chain 5